MSPDRIYIIARIMHNMQGIADGGTGSRSFVIVVKTGIINTGKEMVMAGDMGMDMDMVMDTEDIK